MQSTLLMSTWNPQLKCAPPEETCTWYFITFRNIKEVKTITATPQHYTESARLQIFMNCSRFFSHPMHELEFATILPPLMLLPLCVFFFFHNPVNFLLHCEGGRAAHVLYGLFKAQHHFCCCVFSFSSVSVSVLCERSFRNQMINIFNQINHRAAVD